MTREAGRPEVLPREGRALSRLREATAGLQPAADLDGLFDALARWGAILLECPAAVLWLVNAPGRFLYRAAAAGLGPGTDEHVMNLPFLDTLEGRAVRTGEPAAGAMIASRAVGYRPLLGAGLRNALAVPVAGRKGPPLAVLSFLRGFHTEFSPEEVELARLFGASAGLALENADREANERRVALVVRDALSPGVLPEIPGLELGVQLEPRPDGGAAGGGFFDVMAVEGTFALAYGELFGPDSREPSFAVLVRSMLREHVSREPAPTALARALSRRMSETFRQNLLLSLVYAVLDPTFRQMRVATCGALPVVLVRGGRAEPLEVSGPVVGAYDAEPYLESEVTLQPGDTLFGSTGIWCDRNERWLADVRSVSTSIQQRGGEDVAILAKSLLEQRRASRASSAGGDLVAVAMRATP